VETVHACVKVDDTVPGIEEGLNAGMWTVAAAPISGNEVGLSLADWEALSPGGAAAAPSCRSLCPRCAPGGAHYVIDSIADAALCLDDRRRLARGERP
jgi:phosphonoacetaldehyde hydrolase